MIVIKYFLSAGLLTAAHVLSAQNVGIGTNNPHASAQLDISSTSRGLLIPRLTTLQRTAIGTPANGLMVYDTNLNAFWYYNGTAWAAMNSAGNNYWTANGNHIYNNNSGNVGIGTTTAPARLTVDSSMMVDYENSNQGSLDRSSLYFGSDKRVGIIRSFLSGSSGRNGLGFFTNNTRRVTIDSTGQVGIGTVNPIQTLHVNGVSYFSGNVGIGSGAPDYAFENKWGYNYMLYSLGIGTLPSTSYLLDIGPQSVRFQGDVRINGVLNPNNTLTIGNNTVVDGTLTANNAVVDGTLTANNAVVDGTLTANNAVVDGTLTVNNGKGVAYHGNSATNLRIYQFTTATFTAILPGHGISAEGAISFNGGFTGTPRVFVGDIDVTGGTTGQLYMVQLQLYGCATSNGTTTCKARLINNSPSAVNYSITWNCIAIGN